MAIRHRLIALERLAADAPTPPVAGAVPDAATLDGMTDAELLQLWRDTVLRPCPPRTAKDIAEVERLRRLPDAELRRLHAEALGLDDGGHAT